MYSGATSSSPGQQRVPCSNVKRRTKSSSASGANTVPGPSSAIGRMSTVPDRPSLKRTMNRWFPRYVASSILSNITTSSHQRLDSAKLTGRAQGLPVLQQLRLMQSGPLHHQAQHPGWQVALHHAEGFDQQGRFKLIVARVKMGWIVFPKCIRMTTPRKREISGIAAPFTPS